MQTYTVDIAGEPVTLPIVAINDKLAISLLMVIDMGVRFGERIGKALAAKLGPLKPDIVVGAATLGIPVVIEVSFGRRTGAGGAVGDDGEQTAPDARPPFGASACRPAGCGGR
jgi:hypothetical protein